MVLADPPTSSTDALAPSSPSHAAATSANTSSRSHYHQDDSHTIEQLDIVEKAPAKDDADDAAPVDGLRGLVRAFVLLRRPVLGVAMGMTVLSFVLIALFLGSGADEVARINRANVLVVDMDPATPMSRALLGTIAAWNGLHVTNITGFVQTLPQMVYQDGTQLYPAGLSDVEAAVYRGDNAVYGAVLIAPQAFATLYDALINPAAPPYNPQGVVTIVFDEGRNSNFIDGFIFADAFEFAVFFAQAFSTVLMKDIVAPMLHNATLVPIIAQTMANNPAAFATPISFTVDNIHPVAPFAPSIVGGYITTVAVIFQFIFSMFAAIILNIASGSMAKKMHLWQLQVVRVCGVLIASLFMSLLIAAQVPMYGGYIYAGWGSYWALVWFTMWGFQLTVLSLFIAFPSPLAGLLMISFLLSNVSSATFGAPLEIIDTFYLYGYMMPFRASISAARYILFGSYNRLYQDLPILMAWIIAPLCIIIIATFIQYRLAARKSLANSANNV